MYVTDFVLIVASIVCFLAAWVNWPKAPLRWEFLGYACLAATLL